MKLHLPNGLRKAVLACMAAAAVVYSTTVASAALTTVADMASLVSTGTAGAGVMNLSTGSDTVYKFSNSGAILNISNSNVITALSGNTGFVTIAAWINQNDGAEDSIFSVGGQNNGFKFALKSDYLQLTTKGVADKNATGMTTTENTWTLVAVTIDLDKEGSDSYFFTGATGYTDLSRSVA